jgi:hypothetical protein
MDVLVWGIVAVLGVWALCKTGRDIAGIKWDGKR